MAGLRSTWRIAVWYGWKGRCTSQEVQEFYDSLPDKLEEVYAVWIDSLFITPLSGLNKLPVAEKTLIVTELYSIGAIGKYSSLFPHQMIVTGYAGTSSSQEWLRVVKN